MKYLLIALAALTLSLTGARAEDAPPANPATPAAAPATPAAPVTPTAAPVAPPVANKPDEDTQPGAFKRRLQAAAAVITGNHAAADAAADKDKQIADLAAKVSALEATIKAKETELVEAVAYVKALTTTAPVAGVPAAAAPSPTAQAAAEQVQAGIAAAVRSVGVPTTALAQPVTPAAAAPVVNGRLTETERFAAIRGMMKSLGHEVPAPVPFGSN